MTVLFLTRKYPPSTGGMELFAYDLNKALSAKIKTSLVKWGGSNKALPVVLPLLFFKSLHRLAAGGIDVIHVQDGLLAPMGWLLSKLSRKPYVVVVHGLDLTFGNPLYQMTAPRFVAKANVIFCNSNATAEVAVAHKVPAEKIVVTPLAVDDKIYGKASRADLLRRLQLPENSQILITVGRLVRRKGVAWFVSEVLPGLVQHYPNLVYIVVGEGKQRETIQNAITQSGMTNHVKLLGRVTDDLYEAAYNGADIFVMPNVPVANNIEGFGLVALEAALCELPVVAANTEGIKDAVSNGENGVLVEAKDVNGFQQMISHFLSSPNDAKQFGKQARQFTLAHYQWDKIADRYFDVYKNLQKRR